jgi:hypothetical protein
MAMIKAHTLPATTRRGVLASAQSVKVKTLPGGLVATRQVNFKPGFALPNHVPFTHLSSLASRLSPSLRA